MTRPDPRSGSHDHAPADGFVVDWQLRPPLTEDATEAEALPARAAAGGDARPSL